MRYQRLESSQPAEERLLLDPMVSSESGNAPARKSREDS